MFGISKPKQIKGEIGYYGLTEWWLSVFTDKERDHIEAIFHPMGSDSVTSPLTEGDISSSSQKCAGFLSALAGWFYKIEDRYLAKKIIEKAYEEAIKGPDILDLHFTLQGMIDIYYRDRDTDPVALERAIWACREQIKIAGKAKEAFLEKYPWQELPSHGGYEQLRIILTKQGNFDEAIQICEQAKSQNWNGEWDKKIDTLKKKKAKS